MSRLKVRQANQALWNLERAYWQYVEKNDLAAFSNLWHKDFLGWPWVSSKPVRKDHITDWITSHTNKGLVFKAGEFSEMMEWARANQSMKPTTPLRGAASVLATIPYENCHLILVRRMRVLLILASLLTACETTWQVHQAPNQKPELTATRRVFTF
jgi:hypothetical protein